MLNEQKIQFHLLAIKAAANAMLAEAEKIENMLKSPERKVNETIYQAKMDYQKRFERRIKKSLRQQAP